VVARPPARPGIIDRLHDRLVEDVSVHVDPEPVFRAAGPSHVFHGFPRGRLSAQAADLVTVDGQHACRQRLTGPALPVSSVAAGEHHHIVSPYQPRHPRRISAGSILQAFLPCGAGVAGHGDGQDAGAMTT
jgi:ribulose 1,5-bisphosphate carboxylase large subunit-like protein